jgi:hypothetical protein
VYRISAPGRHLQGARAHRSSGKAQIREERGINLKLDELIRAVDNS